MTIILCSGDIWGVEISESVQTDGVNAQRSTDEDYRVMRLHAIVDYLGPSRFFSIASLYKHKNPCPQMDS